MALKSKGITFQYGDTDAVFSAALNDADWTTIADGVEYTFPEPELDDIDTTTHSTAGNARTYISGLEEGGETEAIFHFDQTVYAALAALKGVEKRFRYVLSNNTSVEGYTGYIKKLNKEAGDIAGLTNTVVACKISGATTYTTIS